MFVLGLSRSKMESLTTWLADAGVPASFLLTDPIPGTVRFSTVHSAKGLDAAYVLLFGAHELEDRGDEEARRLLYIAMTRAREELCVSYHGNSQLMEELREITTQSRAGRPESWPARARAQDRDPRP